MRGAGPRRTRARPGARAGGGGAGGGGGPPGSRGAGHRGRVYPATASPTPDRPRRRARGLDAAEIGQLAGRTAEYAYGRVTDAQFFARPGIQPAWVTFLAGLGIITLAGPDLAAIDRLAQTGGPQ